MGKKVEDFKNIKSLLKQLKEETLTKLKEIVSIEEDTLKKVTKEEVDIVALPRVFTEPTISNQTDTVKKVELVFKEKPEAAAPFQGYVSNEKIIYEPKKWQQQIEEQFNRVPPQPAQEKVRNELTKEQLTFSLRKIDFITKTRKELVREYIIETEASNNESEALEQQTEAIYRLDCVNNLIFNEENKVDIDGLVDIVYNYLKNNKYLSEEKVQKFLLEPYKIFYENLEVGSNKRVNVIYSTLVNYFYDY